MKKSPEKYIEDILYYIQLVYSFMDSVTREEFLASTEKQHAVFACIIFIGEAAYKLPPEFKERYPGIPWRNMADMRHLIVHDYDRVNAQIVWDTIEIDLPELEKNLTLLDKS